MKSRAVRWAFPITSPSAVLRSPNGMTNFRSTELGASDAYDYSHPNRGARHRRVLTVGANEISVTETAKITGTLLAVKNFSNSFSVLMLDAVFPTTQDNQIRDA